MNTFWIITAPSCVGKTTFIEENQRLAEITGLDVPPAIMHPPYKATNKTTYYHRCMTFNSSFLFCQDIPLKCKAVILVATRETKVKRHTKRGSEHARGLPVAKPATPANYLTDDDWRFIYKRALDEFEQLDIPYILLNTEEPDYPIITRGQMEQIL